MNIFEKPDFVKRDKKDVVTTIIFVENGVVSVRNQIFTIFNKITGIKLLRVAMGYQMYKAYVNAFLVIVIILFAGAINRVISSFVDLFLKEIVMFLIVLFIYLFIFVSFLHFKYN